MRLADVRGCSLGGVVAGHRHVLVPSGAGIASFSIDTGILEATFTCKSASGMLSVSISEQNDYIAGGGLLRLMSVSSGLPRLLAIS
jgi:hypothetical protein